MHLFYTPDILTSFELPEEEAAHCLRVLRLGTGDEVMLTDGKGCFYRAEISSVTSKKCLVKILETIPQEPLWTGRLRIAVAPTKNMDRMEWFAEKATEIGVDEIVFLECRYSERRTLKTDRIEKIVVSAMKQSLKSRKPLVVGMTKFNDFVNQDFRGQKFIAHCLDSMDNGLPSLFTLHSSLFTLNGLPSKPLLRDVIVPGEDVEVMIGPEGDFSQEEVALAISKGFRPVSLGKSRLRTETAALVAVMSKN